MIGVALLCVIIGLAGLWLFVSYDFRRVLLSEDREVFEELVQNARRQRFAVAGPWVDFADSKELKSISNPRLKRAAVRLTTVYRWFRMIILLGPALVLLSLLVIVLTGSSGVW